MDRKLIVISIIILVFTACSKNKNDLTWIAINVNVGVQGDAHLISKNGKHILIDTGARRVAKNILIPALQKHGVKELEVLLITHPHFDHYGGTVEVLKAGIKIKQIYMNMPTEDQMKREWWGGKYKHLVSIRHEAKKYGVALKTIQIGELFRFDEHSHLEILYIYDGINTPVGITDINDMSAIVMLYDYQNKYLFTGDLNRKLSRYLKDKPNIQADILKFPHHGAESFAVNDFINNVQAKTVIIPGRKGLWCSKRGKRARQLVKGKKVYINGFHGDISVTSNGQGYSISTQYIPEQICEEEDV